HRGWYWRPQPLRRHLRARGRRPLARRRRFPLTWWAPTGGSSPKGKARGECVRILLGRYQNANQTIACQSKAFSGNKTENKTALEVDLEGDMRIDYASGGSLQTLATGSDFLLGITLSQHRIVRSIRDLV